MLTSSKEEGKKDILTSFKRERKKERKKERYINNF
jgi:hypothetical protein